MIRDGWRVEGLSEVISPSHLIIASLADSLDGSTAPALRHCCQSGRQRLQKSMPISPGCYFYPGLRTWAFDKDAASSFPPISFSPTADERR